VHAVALPNGQYGGIVTELSERNAVEELYTKYSQFKGWTAQPEDQQPEAYEEIVALSGKGGELDILEVGFGNGSFLDWARSRGHRVRGLEILPEAVERARARGHQAFLGKPADDPADLIVAIDVLEHLNLESLLAFFELAERILRPSGAAVVRFPNGFSPFFGAYQYSDMTHSKPMTSEALGQLAMLKGFEVTRAVNPRPRPHGLKRFTKTFLAYRVRDLIETILGYAYFGCRKPMDPNVLVVLVRREGRSIDETRG
jgi:SAM-dependent methyltransferase